MAAVAVIGLGAMGSRIAQRLLAADHDLTVWNRTPERAVALVEQGAQQAASPADAAGDAEFVITMVADPPALAAVTEEPTGVLRSLQPGSVLMEMSTVGAAAVHRLADKMPEGVDLLDTPVLGSLSEVESGELTVFIGGSREAADRCRPVLEVLGRQVYVGGLGSGAAAKLVANTTLLGVLGVLGEAVALADGLRLSRAATYDVLAASPLAAQAERRRPMLDGDPVPRRFALTLARKDADLILAAARDADVDLRLLEATREWLNDADKDGLGADDYSAVLRYIAGQSDAG